MANPALSGIYAIVNRLDGKRYIGSAVDLKSRWRLHRRELNRGVHCNSKLQRAWVKHGAAAFGFIILENCPRVELLAREQAAFARFSPEYNICQVAGSCLGVIHTPSARGNMAAAKIGRRLQADHKASISLGSKEMWAERRRCGAPPQRHSKPRCIKHREKISAAATARWAARRAAGIPNKKHRPRSEEQRQKASAAARAAWERIKAEGRSFRPFSAEHRKNLSVAAKRRQARRKETTHEPEPRLFGHQLEGGG